MDLQEAELEKTYLALSRETHPDTHPGASPAEQVAILSRSADINDAYNVLKDPWRRARAILELREPGIMDQTKQLDPAFLMAAMEEAEAVAHCGESGRTALNAQLETKVQQCLAEITEFIGAGKDRDAATLLHQARYHQKANTDLAEGESL